MRALTLLLAAALWCGTIHAQVPNKLNYQGFLTDPGGTSVTASVPMVFKLYKVAAGGSELYSETQTVAVNAGVFDVVIGAVTPLALDFDVPYYLGVTVGVDTEMTPRQLVTASPYALRAANADALALAATVAGSQISGAIASATLPAGNLSGTVGTAQIAANAVTQAKLSPVSGASAGKVLGTDGANLQWQTAAAGTVTSLAQGAGIVLTPSPITGSGTIAIDPASSTLTGTFFKQGGNDFVATAVLGTTGNNPVEIIANNQRALRVDSGGASPNITLGNQANVAGGGAIAAATVGGGGEPYTNCYEPATDTDDRLCSNRALWFYATVGGGRSNVANSIAATVSGGDTNSAYGSYSTVAGGLRNRASGERSFVAGGDHNTASGQFSFAGGRNAVAAHNGSFVWNSGFLGTSTYSSNAIDSFNIRAPGGFYLEPGTDVKGVLSFGAQTRQMIDLYGATWGIGVQSSTQYYRTGNFFGWYRDGIHSDSALDAGAGGAILMALYPATSPPGVLPTVTGEARAQTFVSTSDRAAKRDFAPVDTKALLAKVVALPIATWHYKNDGATRHIGPVAQDFRRLFEVGGDDLGIATVDADGVALAAIQGLHARLEERDAQLARQQAELDLLKRSMTELRHALQAMTITVAAH